MKTTHIHFTIFYNINVNIIIIIIIIIIINLLLRNYKDWDQTTLT